MDHTELFDEMVYEIFVSIDWIIQIGTEKGHEKWGTLDHFFGAPIGGHEHKSVQVHTLDSNEYVWVDFNIAKAFLMKLQQQKS